MKQNTSTTICGIWNAFINQKIDYMKFHAAKLQALVVECDNYLL